MMKKVAPSKVSILKDGKFYREVPVIETILHPDSKNFPTVVDGMKVLELKTALGSRYFGIEDGYISSKLEMVVWGGFVNEKNELVKNWKDEK